MEQPDKDLHWVVLDLGAGCRVQNDDACASHINEGFTARGIYPVNHYNTTRGEQDISGMKIAVKDGVSIGQDRLFFKEGLSD